MMRKFDDPAVAAAFDGFPFEQRKRLMALREMVFSVATRADGVGPVHETLKWGQPAYLTPQTKSGTTVRLGVTKAEDVAIFTHCQTTLMSEFRAQFPTEFAYDGNRAVLVAQDAETTPLEVLLRRALTYHLKG